MITCSIKCGMNHLPIQPLHRWSLGMDKWFLLTFYNGCDYLSMLGLKLIHVRKRAPRKQIIPYVLLFFCLVLSYIMRGNNVHLTQIWHLSGCISHGMQCTSSNFTLNFYLAHWGRVTHICVSNITTIGSDNGLSPGRRQAIIRTKAGILLIEPLGTNFNGISIEMLIFSLKKIDFKMSSGKWRPFCLGLNVLTINF